MSIQLDCLANIIGLSDTDCECLIDSKPIDAGLSDSGLFIDHLPYVVLKYTSDCQVGSVWDHLSRARVNAIKRFQSELLACIRSQTALRRKPFKGTIGDPLKFNSNVVLDKTFHGQWWYMAGVHGGYIKIRRIGAAFNQTTTIDLSVYANYDEDALHTVQIQTLADKMKWNDVDIILPLKPQYGSHNQFHWLFTPVGGIAAKNVRIQCLSCNASSFKPSWNPSSPQFNSRVDSDDYGWANWMLATGAKGNAVADRGLFQVVNESQGLVFEIELLCMGESVICDGDAIDYQGNPFAMVMAYAVQYLAGHLFMGSILSGGNPDAFTATNAETLSNMQGGFLSEYTSRLNWLCQEMTRPENINLQSDCFDCKDLYGFIKAGIFS